MAKAIPHTATGDYYVFFGTGTIQQQTNPVLAEGLKASGWAGPYATMQDAHDAINHSPTQQVKDAAGSGLSGVNAVGDFATRLTDPHTWTRVGEFAVGVILLYVGMKTMFPAQVGAITGPVKSAAKSAAFAFPK